MSSPPDADSGPVMPMTRPVLGRGAFSDRVMAEVARTPRPTPARAFVRSLLRLSPRDALAALATSRRMANQRDGSVTSDRRLRALALALAVVMVIAVGAPLATSGRLHLFGTSQGMPQPGGADAPAGVVKSSAQESISPEGSQAAKKKAARKAKKRAAATRQKRAAAAAKARAVERARQETATVRSKSSDGARRRSPVITGPRRKVEREHREDREDREDKEDREDREEREDREDREDRD